MTDESLLACRRFEELTAAQAATTGSVVRCCDRCGWRVWLVPRNLLLRARVVCRECAAELAVETMLGGQPRVILPARPIVDAMTEHEGN